MSEVEIDPGERRRYCRCILCLALPRWCRCGGAHT